MTLQPFGPWLPDLSTFSAAVATEALNVVPSQAGYKPYPSFAAISSAISSRVMGGFAMRGLTGAIFNFCGNAAKLYKLNSTGLTWSDVSRTVGGAYGTPVDGWWSFAPFGDYLIACNQADATQSFQLSSSTNFAALAGSPPRAQFAGTIRDFVALARLSTAYNRIQWCGINDITAWTPSALTMADYQDFPEGGGIMGFVGGEYGVVLQERAIQRMAFEGPPTVFRFDKISNVTGCAVERSVAAYDNLVFFLGHSGFYMLRGGSELTEIGNDKIDNWIASKMDFSATALCSAAIDPNRKLYMFSFASGASSGAGYCDSLLSYHWPTGQWTRLKIDLELLYSGVVQASVTIDGLDAYSATIDGLVYPFDSLFYAGSGKVTLSGFDKTHAQGYFSGLNLEGTVETGDVQAVNGRKAMLRGLRPMVEGLNATPVLMPRYRDRLQDAITNAASVPANSNGYCPTRVNARYHRARVTIPAGAIWDRAIGVDDLKFSAMGGR